MPFKLKLYRYVDLKCHHFLLGLDCAQTPILSHFLRLLLSVIISTYMYNFTFFSLLHSPKDIVFCASFSFSFFFLSLLFLTEHCLCFPGLSRCFNAALTVITCRSFNTRKRGQLWSLSKSCVFNPPFYVSLSFFPPLLFLSKFHAPSTKLTAFPRPR